METFYLIDFENVHNNGIANIDNLSNEEKQLLLDRTFLHIWEIIRFIINSKNTKCIKHSTGSILA